MTEQTVLTTCTYCGCGCGCYLHVDQGRVVGVSPSRNHPITRNNLCLKGWQLHQLIHHPDRLTTPLVRKNGRLRKASWEEALSRAAQGFSDIQRRHGGRALGVLASAKCTTEESYLLQKFARVVLQTNNIDHCARL